METQYFSRPEGKLAYSDYGGSGEPVIMLPGMGALRSEYRYLAPILSDSGYRPITVDLRGQGESSVPWKIYDVPSVGKDILDLIEYLNAGPAHVIGTSFAPSAIVWAAVERSDLIKSIVLISPFVRQVKVNPIMQMVMWLMLNNPLRVRTWGMYYSTFYPTVKPPDFQHYMAQLMLNLAGPGRFKAVKALGTSSRQPSEERLSQLKTPTLIVMGTKDADFPDPVEEGKIIAEQICGSMALIEGAGHYPQTEMPEKTAAAVIDFLKYSGQSWEYSAAESLVIRDLSLIKN
jgi:pimeloyl-ACP methyl ester carboxylesterase